MTELHLESLDKPRQAVFNKLIKFKPIGVLAGGTAIALQIGHRTSVDFDIFTYQPLNKRLYESVKKVFDPGTVKMYSSDVQLNIGTPEGIKVTFYYSGHVPHEPLVNTHSISLLGLGDLASNKAAVIGDRGKWRDYVDLYFLLKGGFISLKKIIDLSELRFGGEFSRKLFLEQLVYFNDITDYDIQFLKDNVNPDLIKEFLRESVRQFIDNT